MENYVQGLIQNIEKMLTGFASEDDSIDEITGEMLLNKNVREIPSLLEPLLPVSGLVCLTGSSDTGKSAFLRQLSMSVSAGLDSFLGMKLNVVHHSAIYVATEDDACRSPGREGAAHQGTHCQGGHLN
ncbi:MAG: AAA family ATPase [Prevotella sp.]|nr:AAA family ATPase [Prevotella sp.]